MTNTYSICGISFGTQKELIGYIQSILHKYDLGSALDENDFNFIYDLLKHHSEAKEKIGCGIQSIKIDKAVHGTTCFYLQRTDGSKDDFSFITCIKNYKAIL